MHSVIKHIHVLFAVVSISLFFARGVALLAGSESPRRRWVRRLTDMVDSVLLIAAISLVVITGQYPIATPWVTAKVIGLLAYIGLGVVAFRFAQTRGSRLLAFLAALVVAGYIVSVAVTKSPEGFLIRLLG